MENFKNIVMLILCIPETIAFCIVFIPIYLLRLVFTNKATGWDFYINAAYNRKNIIQKIFNICILIGFIYFFGFAEGIIFYSFTQILLTETTI